MEANICGWSAIVVLAELNSPRDTLSVVRKRRVIEFRLYRARACGSGFLAYITSAFSCLRLFCFAVLIIPNVFSVVSFMPFIIFDIPSAIETTRCFKVVFISSKKLDTAMRKSTSCLTFRVPRALLRSMSPQVDALEVTSIKPFLCVCTVTIVWKLWRIRTRCVGRTPG